MPLQSKNSYKFWLNATIVIGVLISLSSGLFSYAYYKEKEDARLELMRNEVVILVKNRMAAYEQVLKSGVGFFNASNGVSRDEWAIFAKEQKLDENFKGIQGFGYSEVVLPNDKQKHEQRIKKEGFANFKIHPDGQRELYTSIIYLEPFDERNVRAFGYDMFSEKVRAEAMTKAMQSGEATLSGKIKLVQESDTDVQAGFLMYLPVYKKGFKLETPQDRVLAIQGFVYAPFRANDFMRGVLGSTYSDTHFEIYDGAFATKENVLYSSSIKNCLSTLHKEIRIIVNGRTWTLTFKTNRRLESEHIYIIFLIPFFVLIMITLLYLLLNSLIKTREKAIQIAKKVTQELHVSEERLRFALEGAGDGLWDWNIKTNEFYVSKRWKEMLGFKEDEIDSNLEEWKNRIHPQDLEQAYADVTAHIQGKSDSYINEHRVKCKDGSYKWVLDRGVIASRDIDGAPLRIVGSYSDISARKQSQLKFMLLVDENIIYSTTDLDGKIIQVSQAFCNISGYDKDELLGKSHNITRDPETPKAVYQKLWATIQSGKKWQGEIKNIHKNGSAYWLDTSISPIKNEEGETTGYTAIRHDVTDKKHIEELSITDRLTQLYNRLKLDEIFAMKLAIAGRYNTPFSIIMIDIDYFKLVNDTWGHQVGDDVLKEFARIIKDNIRQSDVVGRWGGEEFLILSSYTDIDAAMELAEKLRELVFLFKFSIAEHKTASFGVSSYHPGDDEKTMVKRADDALYRSKERGRNRVEAELF